MCSNSAPCPPSPSSKKRCKSQLLAPAHFASACRCTAWQIWFPRIPHPAPGHTPPPGSPCADAQPRPLSALWAEGCWGRWTRAQGLSKAGSWIQASDAMATVTIVTQLCLPTTICCGLHRLEPAERGRGQSPAHSGEGYGFSGGCPHRPLLPPPLPSLSSHLQ